jgi:hypothetical protein
VAMAIGKWGRGCWWPMGAPLHLTSFCPAPTRPHQVCCARPHQWRLPPPFSRLTPRRDIRKTSREIQWWI